jgi:DNA-binding IclR family transcriptional regulator
MSEQISRVSHDGWANSGDIQAVSRAAQILSLFSQQVPVLTVAAAAAALGLNRTTVHRYFTSLVSAQLLSRDEETGGYVPGDLAVQLGCFSLGRRTVLELAERHLRELSAASRMTAVVSLWGAAGPVVAKVHEDRSNAVLITVPVGTQLNLETAQSVLFLAFMPDQLAMHALLRMLPPAAQETISARVSQAREQVAAAASFEDGISSVAAPVFSPTGICATMALVHTSAMLPASIDSAQALRVRAAARELTEEMGGPSMPGAGAGPYRTRWPEP